MLALWPNQLFVLLSLDKLAISYRTGLTKKVLSEKVVNFTRLPDSTWQDVLIQFTQILSSFSPYPNTQLHVLLASDLARYTILPAHENGITKDEKQAYANAIFTETYGGDVAQWMIKCDDSAPFESTLACAIDHALLSNIESIAEQFELTLCSVQPYLISALNKFYKEMRGVEVIFVVVELNRMLLTSFSNGVCKKIKSFKFEHDWEAVLTDTLNREKVYGEQNTNNVLIYAPMQKNISLTTLKGWQITRVKSKQLSLANDPALNMLGVCT